MIAGIILAAGKGSRMGKDKLSLMLQGKPILEHVIISAKASALDQIILVRGDYSVGQALGDKYQIKTIYNERWSRGMSTSIIAGMGGLEEDCEGAMFLLGDMPFVTKNTINQIIETYRCTGKEIIVPMVQGKRGNPVLFHQAFFPELRQLTGDKGARDIIEKHPARVEKVYFEEESTTIDIDTVEEYEKYGLWRSSRDE